MKILPQPSFLAYLDLVCCAMGAGLLMFLIAVSAAPVEKPTARESQLLAIRCHHLGKEGDKEGGPRLEVGIEFRRPGSSEWVRSVGPDQLGFVAPTDPKSGAEACVILLAPREGIWEFRPYLVDYPRGTTEPVLVKLEAYGQPVVPDEPAGVQPLRKTGDAGTVLKVRVQAPPRRPGK
jgi:hypothetical protein